MSIYDNQYLFPLLESPKRQIDIFAMIFPKKIKFNTKPYYKCNCGYEVTRKPVKKEKCKKCKSLYSYTDKSGFLFKNYRELTIDIPQSTMDVISWMTNSKSALKKLLKDGLIRIVKIKGNVYRNKGVYYDINFSKIAELMLNQIKESSTWYGFFLRHGESKKIQKTEEYKDVQENFKRWKDELIEFLKNNRDLFSMQEWSFLLSDVHSGVVGNNKFYDVKFEPPFNSVFGFINFVFLIMLIEQRKTSLYDGRTLELISLELKLTESLDKLSERQAFQLGQRIGEIGKFKFKQVNTDILAEIYAGYFSSFLLKKLPPYKAQEFYDLIEQGVRVEQEQLPFTYFFEKNVPKMFENLINI